MRVLFCVLLSLAMLSAFGQVNPEIQLTRVIHDTSRNNDLKWLITIDY